ncbi:hypothetical protein NX02_09855 [Sphingomonas sanxanigenens DSM 19645 = NX02]|uniref:Uncharacterized protein n=1 Tax=Sphingomonas sanxanigenens DSM 19645 = NX02 TaxID=1123269 RepID=W0A9C2_9SPHN|nr:hypothetical protein NX02_09855 [Sphingomonas sanxanigenens DSM 19645 = NX02]
MIEVTLRDELNAHPFKIAEVTRRQLVRKTHLLSCEQQRYQDMPRRQSEPVGADKMIVEPRAGIAAFDLPKPANAHTKLARQIALRQAPLLPCLFNLSS